jgi:hypothetical protein
MKNTSILPMLRAKVARCQAVKFLIVLMAMVAAREASAGLLAYEGFQYVPGQPLPSMIGGIGWAPGPWTGSSQMADQPPSLSYPTALPSTGDALVNPAPGEAWRYFAAPINNAGNDIWISFQQLSTTAAPGAFVDIIPLTGPDIQVNKDGFGAITLNGLAAGLSSGFGNIDFFVVQIRRFGGGLSMVNLYLNPGVVLGPPNASFPIPLVVQANQFYYRSLMGEYLDEIRVGTTPQDVAAAVSVGVPPLGIAPSPNGLTVSWPDLGDFTLQQSSDLTPGSWATSGYAITTSNGTNSITVPPPFTGNVFFRLSNP